MNIPVFAIISTGLVGFVCTLAPVLLALWLYRVKKGAGRSFFWGCGAYMVLVLGLQRTTSDLLALLPISQEPWFAVLYSGFTAAAITCFGLYICFCWLMKEQRTLPDALLAGLGYAWCDAFFMTGLDMLYASLLGNALRKSPELLITPETAEMYEAFAAQLTGTDPVEVLLIGLARPASTAMVAALAVLIMTAVTRRNIWPLLGAFGLHLVCAALCVWVYYTGSAALWQGVVQLVFTGLTVLLAWAAGKELPSAQADIPLSQPNAVTWNAPLKRRKM